MHRALNATDCDTRMNVWLQFIFRINWMLIREEISSSKGQHKPEVRINGTTAMTIWSKETTQKITDTSWKEHMDYDYFEIMRFDMCDEIILPSKLGVIWTKTKTCSNPLLFGSLASVLYALCAHYGRIQCIKSHTKPPKCRMNFSIWTKLGSVRSPDNHRSITKIFRFIDSSLSRMKDENDREKKMLSTIPMVLGCGYQCCVCMCVARRPVAQTSLVSTYGTRIIHWKMVDEKKNGLFCFFFIDNFIHKFTTEINF